MIPFFPYASTRSADCLARESEVVSSSESLPLPDNLRSSARFTNEAPQKIPARSEDPQLVHFGLSSIFPTMMDSKRFEQLKQRRLTCSLKTDDFMPSTLFCPDSS